MLLENEKTEPKYFHAWAHVKDLKSECECSLFPQDAEYKNHGLSVDLYKLTKIKAGQTVKRHEAPRGQLSYMLVGDNSFNNYRISIHVPSYKNTPTVPHMLRNNTVADAGLIIASIDPCFSCLDR